MNIAPVLRELIAAGLSGEALILAVERIEASIEEPDTRTARQQRNARYYQERLKRRLKASESDAPLPPPQEKERFPQTPLKKTHPPVSEAKASSTPVADLDFESCWRAYPHRKGRSSKPKSLTAWKALPREHRPRLLAAIKRYADEGHEPKADCGAKAFELWLKDHRFLDWMPPEDIPATPLSAEEQAAKDAKWTAYLTRLESEQIAQA